MFQQNRGYGLNRSGQVRIDYTGLTLTGFTGETPRLFPFDTAVASIHAWPTSVWPSNDITRVYANIYDSTTHKLRENNILGQSTLWRVNGTFANKNLNNNGALDIQFYNPDSGFYTGASITLPSSRTTGPFTVFILTIADNDSLAVGKGYQLRATVSFSDATMSVNISNIVRSSRSIEDYGYVLPQ